LDWIANHFSTVQEVVTNLQWDTIARRLLYDRVVQALHNPETQTVTLQYLQRYALRDNRFNIA
jgi:hypothetical protein